MNVRKLLGRLNPGAIRYDGVPGGVPELTFEDILGALARVPQGLGYELFTHLWWPDGARHSVEELLIDMVRVQFREFWHRMEALQIAQLAVHLAEDRSASERAAARAELATAKSQSWPALGEHTRYGPIRVAVLREMGTPSLCANCHGRGTIVRGSLVIACSACHGFGRRTPSDRQRADAIGIDEANYRRAWRSPYEYLLTHCVEEEKRAANRMADALQLSVA